MERRTWPGWFNLLTPTESCCPRGWWMLLGASLGWNFPRGPVAKTSEEANYVGGIGGSGRW
jgi:hypothetical protein